MERPAQHAPRGLVGHRVGGGARAVAVDQRPGLDAAVDQIDAFQQRLDQVDGREHLLADRSGGGGDAEGVQAHGAGSM